MLPRFDRLVEQLRPHLKSRPNAYRSDSDAADLASRTGLPVDVVRRVALSSELANRSGTSAAQLFDALPKKLPPLRADPALIRAELERVRSPAPSSTITPGSVDAILGALEQLRPKQSFGALSIDQLVANESRQGKRRVSAVLRKLGVGTPSELLAIEPRRLRDVIEPDGADMRTVAELRTHARLALLELSDAGRATLARLGYSGPSAVASSPLADFRTKVGRLLGVAEAERIHAVARAQAAVLDHLDRATRSYAAYAAGGVEEGAFADDDVMCGCRDCEAATSPAAYLTDLLAYCVAKLAWQHNPVFPTEAVSPALLSLLLQQPLGDLPADCASAEERISQVRLCIESLLALLRQNLSADPDAPCLPIARPISFAIAADIDGDRRDELIVGFEPDNAALLGSGRPVGTGCWVLRYDTTLRRWTHVAPGGDPTTASFYLPPEHSVTFAVAGRLRNDLLALRQDRRQLVFALKPLQGGSPFFWALEFDPTFKRWAHATLPLSGSPVSAGGTFAAGVNDFGLGQAGISLQGALSADVDGDQLDEFVAYGSTPQHVNAFWVFKLLPQGWQILGPQNQPYDISFDCFPPAPAVDFSINLAIAGDVNHDGREEIIAFSNAPGGAGRAPWIMLFDPVASTWAHLSPPGTRAFDLDADLWPQPWRTAHALVGDFVGVNSANLVAAPARYAAPAASDPELFSVLGYADPGPPGFPSLDIVEQFDCSLTTHDILFTVAADVDGDSRDELVAFLRVGTAYGAYAMDRANAGWRHLGPLAGNPFGADLEWTAGGLRPAVRAFAADVDGDGADEIVVTGTSCTDIWVLKYSQANAKWEHLRSTTDPPPTRYLADAYEALLEQIGVSYAEIRLARGAGTASRVALADRLSLTLGARTGAAGDPLDQLFIDPGSLSEVRLEALFGLVSTTRDPLSNISVEGDTDAQTRHWRLEGAAWSADPSTATTDADGRLYATIGFNAVGAKAGRCPPRSWNLKAAVSR